MSEAHNALMKQDSNANYLNSSIQEIDRVFLTATLLKR